MSAHVIMAGKCFDSFIGKELRNRQAWKRYQMECKKLGILCSCRVPTRASPYWLVLGTTLRIWTRKHAQGK